MDKEKQLKDLANEILKTLGTVSEKARHVLDVRRPIRGSDVTTGFNPMLGGRNPAEAASLATDAVLRSLQHLLTEPFVARVKARTSEGKVLTYFIVRMTRPDGCDPEGAKLVGYNSARGRIGEHPVGALVSVPAPGGEEELEILERIMLVPKFEAGVWDGLNDRIEQGDNRLTIESLLRYVGTLDQEQISSAFDDLLKETEGSEAVREGFRRRVISAMSLRDQPILDQYQGDVFRRELSTRLFLSGPPGTGKTTTLIRRLAHKLSPEGLSESEKETLEEARAEPLVHRGWVMFTPTELLKGYLKESFNRERIAASSEQVTTWDLKRNHLGRDVLKLLRSPTSGRLVLQSERVFLKSVDSSSQRALFDAFDEHYRNETSSRFGAHAAVLKKYARDADQKPIQDILQWSTRADFEGLLRLVENSRGVTTHARLVRDETDSLLRDLSRRAVNANILADLEKRIDEVLPPRAVEADDDAEEGDSDEAETAPIASDNPRARLAAAIPAAIRALAISLEQGRALKEKSRYFRLAGVLRERLEDDRLKELGRRWRFRRALDAFQNLHSLIFTDVATAWRRFRRVMTAEGRFFAPEARTADTAVTPQEVDVLILTCLRIARRILARVRKPGDVGYALLESVRGEATLQVLVDEVTDFSPIQLACMLELAHPKFRSLFVSGDLRQRVTLEGMSSFSDFQWVSADFEQKDVNIGYRQSGPLRAFSTELSKLMEGPTTTPSAPPNVEEANLRPLLLENASDTATAQWLADRIVEIERQLKARPSIAVFVDHVDAIEPLVARLQRLLAPENIQVIGCPDGRAVGEEEQVRVFDVQHVKGLEFEAVFFVGIDRMQQRQPELFAQRMYVGSTRAATYLGLTCAGGLPARLEPVRSLIGESWGQ